MRQATVYTYFAFGYNYRLLSYECEGILVHGKTDSLISRIDDFFSACNELNLQVTKQAANSLREIRDKAKKLPADAKVDKVLAEKVSKAIEDIDKTLDAELQLRHAYFVTPKRFDTDHLLNQPSSLFGGFVFDVLPQICRYDLKRAGRCIAFGLATASAFHLMRATEGVLRFYYQTIVARGRIKTLLWGPMLEHLKMRRDHPSQLLLDHLDHIRVNFRNPTQHPDSCYSLDEAQDLLAVCIDAINRMIRDLFERKLLQKPPF